MKGIMSGNLHYILGLGRKEGKYIKKKQLNVTQFLGCI